MADSRPQTEQSIIQTFFAHKFLLQAEFDSKLNQLSRATNASFRRRDSKPYLGDLTEFQYRKMRYECVHFGKPRSNTKDGTRTNQKTNALDCKCFFIAVFVEKFEDEPSHLQITAQNLEHNHQNKNHLCR